MPKEIHRIAKTYLNDPKEVKIDKKTTTATTIRQRCWWVSGLHKMDALTRFFEYEDFDASIIFVRTKTSTVDIAERLSARGHACEPLNGDMSQQHRERTVEKLKNGKVDIVVATDIAARGLDVERISHVINFDIPYDSESYVHRIGRTGRAGRSGEAVLFVSPRERKMLKTIERAIGQPIENMEMPSAKEINEKRIEKFKSQIGKTIAEQDLSFYTEMFSQLMDEQDVNEMQIAAALAYLKHGKEGLLVSDRPIKQARPERGDRDDSRRGRGEGRYEKIALVAEPLKEHPDVEMTRYRIEVGRKDGVKPGNIVGAIANEADLNSDYIGQIELREGFSTIDLPAGMPKPVMQHLAQVKVCNRPLKISKFKGDESGAGQPRRGGGSKPPRGRSGKPARGKGGSKPNRSGPRPSKRPSAQ